MHTHITPTRIMGAHTYTNAHTHARSHSHTHSHARAHVPTRTHLGAAFVREDTTEAAHHEVQLHARAAAPVCTFVCLSVVCCLPACLSVCLFSCRSVCLLICLSVCLFRLFVCQCVAIPHTTNSAAQHRAGKGEGCGRLGASLANGRVSGLHFTRVGGTLVTTWPCSTTTSPLRLVSMLL